jgi:hypothetical protein
VPGPDASHATVAAYGPRSVVRPAASCRSNDPAEPAPAPRGPAATRDAVAWRGGERGAGQMLIPPVASRAIAAAAMIVAVSQPRILAALPFT